jgi:predicted KAP-like P-loop ATPase
VIGLHGKWGSGKSSVKNLCLEYLRKQKDKPAVIEFTPWLFTNQEELLAAFFRELGAKANSFEKAGEREAFAQDWKLYSSMLKLASPVLLLAPALLPFLAPFLGGVCTRS